MKSRIIPLFVLFLFALEAQAGTIYGRVIDAFTSEALVGASISVLNTKYGASTDQNGYYRILRVPAGTYSLKCTYVGYQTVILREVVVRDSGRTIAHFQLPPAGVQLGAIEINAARPPAMMSATNTVGGSGVQQQFNTEEYSQIVDNAFHAVLLNPLSTFAIDVDVASYSNIRRFVQMGQVPPPDAVRTEEMINYFSYDYPQPTDDRPFSITTEIASCPWNPTHNLLLLGLQGRKIPMANLPPTNLVFLIDVSGSMDAPNKLPLVQASLRMLAQQMRPVDLISIVVYAGSAGLVLPATHGNERAKIAEAIDGLSAGGSTAGGAGILLAYKTALDHYLPEGNNRIVWATDGDFNVGVSSTSDLVRLVEEKRKSGVFLSLLGFGMGNLKDSRMEQLADKGNGNYAYIDSFTEARRVLVGQLAGTLFTIAKDVKIQIEFNPSRVEAYRLIGYENRLLSKEDFNDDKKDAGELGSGHNVTALYELVPPGVEYPKANVDSLKYQVPSAPSSASTTDELMTIKLRYKLPADTSSHLMTRSVKDQTVSFGAATDDLRFASAVAEFAMLLRDSPFKGSSSFNGVFERASKSLGSDPEAYRAEFIRLVRSTQELMKQVE